MRRWLVAATVPLVLLVPACGEEANEVAEPRVTFPVTIEAANGPVAIPTLPERIVSLSPTATEMLFAIEAGDQVVAADANSNYPADAPKTDLSAYEPNAEAIAKEEPDLVVVSDDIGEVVRSLTALDIPTLHMPAAKNIQDSYRQIEQLGTATGHVAEAADVVRTMTSKIEELTADAAERKLTYYHELDPKYFSVTSNTFIGQVYELLGLENIADEAQGADSGYPQLSAEYIIQADPDVIFLADTKCCGQSPEKIGARPGWNQITAVRNGAVVGLDDDIASRWGPRIVELLEVVAERIDELEPAGG